MYFKKLPNIFYQFDIGNKATLKPVKDITFNVRLRREILESILLYNTYNIQDGETPEIIAHKYYGSAEYHWIILMANQIVDVTTEWPLAYGSFNEYVQTKYNTFNATSWSYDVVTFDEVTTTTVTLTIPNHAISLAYRGKIAIDKAFVSQTNEVGTMTIEAATGLANTMEVTDVTANTIVFETSGTITGVPYTGLIARTSNLEYQTHHYQKDSFQVMPDVVGATPVTNYDYETNLNDDKRQIKLISPDIIDRILSQFKSVK